MDNSIKITTRFNANEIRQTVTDPLALSVAEAITERLVDLRDQGVKRALKELGWVSPEEAGVLKAKWQAEALTSVIEDAPFVQADVLSWLDDRIHELHQQTQEPTPNGSD